MVEKTFRVRKGLDVEGPDKDASIINGVLTLGTIGNISGSSSSILAINSLGSVNINLDTDANDTISVFRIKEDNTDFFVIDNDGQVGIGTTAPATKLHIERSESDSENLMLRLRDSTVNAVGERIGIEGYWNTVPAGDIEFELTNTSSGASAIVFSPHSTGGTKTEAMRIASDGNVGIGITAPLFPLHLKYTDSRTDPQGTGSSTGAGAIGATAQGGGLYVENQSTATGAWAGATFRVGTADARIAYKSTGTNQGQMSFYLDANDSPNQLILEEVFRLIGGNTGSGQAFNSAYVNGRLGIGTSTPSSLLHIHGDMADGKQGILITRNDTSTADTNLLGAIGFDSSDGNIPSKATEASAGIAAYAAEDHGTGDKGGDLVFFTSPIDQNDDTDALERMRIDSQGNVGIGTTSPARPFHVVGDAYVQNGDILLSRGNFYLQDASDATKRGSFSSDGVWAWENVNVGIGTTSP